MAKLGNFFTSNAKELWWIAVIVPALFLSDGAFILYKEPWRPFPLLDQCVFAVFGLVLVVAVVRLWDQVAPVLHYLVGAACAIAAAITAAAWGATALDGISSFLLAPVGTKPDHVYEGWGSGWIFYGVVAVVLYIAYKILGVSYKQKEPVPL